MLRTIYAAVLTNSRGIIVDMPIAADSMDDLDKVIAKVFPGGVYIDSFGNKEKGTVSTHKMIYTCSEEVNKLDDSKSQQPSKKPRATSARKRLSAAV